MKYVPINPQPKTLISGMKVQMGPDWDQFTVGYDGVTASSIGTVVEEYMPAWFSVRWDKVHGDIYCYGKTIFTEKFCREVQAVEPVEEPEPARFKVGDRVQINKTYQGGWCGSPGRMGTIIRDDGGDSRNGQPFRVRFDSEERGSDPFPWLDLRMIERAEQDSTISPPAFKVGDRVVVLDNCGYTYNVIGQTGTIMRQYGRDLFRVSLPSYSDGLNFNTEEMVLASVETPIEAAQARIDGFEKCHTQCKDLLDSPRHEPMVDAVRKVIAERDTLKAQIAAAKQALK